MTWLLVALGAAVGAPLRYITDRFVQARIGGLFPWGTFAVNMAGSFVLGLVVAIPVSPAVAALVGTGFCGALTTYSTFGFETMKLAGQGRRWLAAGNALLSLAAGLGAAGLGLLVGSIAGGR